MTFLVQRFIATPTWLTRLLTRFWDIAGSVGIRTKVLGIVVGVIVLLGVFVTIQLRAALYQTLEAELYTQGLDLMRFVSGRLETLLAEGDEAAIGDYLFGLQEHYSGNGHNTLIDYVFIERIDETTGEISVIASTVPNIPPNVLALPENPSPDLARHLTTVNGDVIDVGARVGDDQTILRVGLAEDNIEHVVNIVLMQIFTLTLVMIVVGFGAAFFLTWILTRPIYSLVQATKAVAQGDFSQQVPRWANDEIGALSESFNAMTRSLARAEQERGERDAMRQNYIRGVIAAQEDERKRIARELHDSTSQSLTSLIVGLRNLESANDMDAMRAQIKDIRQVANQTLEEVHQIAWQLRPTVLDDLGLNAALERYIRDFQVRYGIPVDFAVRNLSERLPREHETTLYRIVQEALTNIARHSKAQNASVLIEQRANPTPRIRVIIEDNGVGFDPSTKIMSEKSLGLHGIRERTQLLGGTLTIESQPGQGTSLFVEIPVGLTESESA